MINILCWNARGLGIPHKRRALKDLIYFNKIDIVGIQETKKDSFSSRILKALSPSITFWLYKSSIGSSGGILLGINESKFEILDSWINDFSISVHIKNNNNSFEWLLTVVYGPTISSHRSAFLNELQQTSLLGPLAWLACGDFNLIRSRNERQGPSFNISLSNRFNNLISDLHLIELPLHNRKFTWARSASSTSKALLDRFFCTHSWLQHYPTSLVTSLPRTFSDHNPLLLHTSSISTYHSNSIRFEKTWLEQEGFINLLIQWWTSFPLDSDIGKSWKLKLQFLRRKLRGWNINFLGAKKRVKQQLLEQISNFECLNESNSLTTSQYTSWQDCQTALHQIYHEEDLYWQ